MPICFISTYYILFGFAIHLMAYFKAHVLFKSKSVLIKVIRRLLTASKTAINLVL
jgi:hypothetical protein